jgi:hypothetical protein
VDFGDIKKFVIYWFMFDCVNRNGCEGTDLNYDGSLDFVDFRIVAERWLEAIMS